MGTVQGHIRDRLGRPLAARILIRNLDDGSFPLSQYRDHPGFWAKGAFSAPLSKGRHEILITHGHFYTPFRTTLQIGAETLTLEAVLREDIPEIFRAYIAGDSHCHYIHGEKEIAVLPEHAARIAEGEGLSYVNYSDDFDLFSKAEKQTHIRAFSTDRFLFGWNREFPKNTVAHVWSLGTTPDPVENNDYQSTRHENFRFYHDLDRDGAFIALAHPLNGWFVDRAYCTNLNATLPLDLVAGAPFHGMDCFPAAEEQQLYFDILNYGWRPIGTTASDSCLDRDCRYSIPGGCRLYTRYAGSLDMKRIAQTLKAGNNFCSTGPLLHLRIADCEPGETLPSPAGKIRCVITAAAVRLPGETIERVELIENGTVIGSWPAPGFRRDFVVETEFEPQPDAWYAARCFGRSSEDHAYGLEAQTALTNPIWSGEKKTPSATESRVVLSVKDRHGGAPLDATIGVLNLAGETTATASTADGVSLTCPALSRLHIRSPGYRDAVVSLYQRSPALELVRSWVTGHGRIPPPDGQQCRYSAPLLRADVFEEMRRALAEITLDVKLVKADRPAPLLGSTHGHTDVSNCAKPEMKIAAVIRKAAELGYRFYGITDHVYPESYRPIRSQVEQFKKNREACLRLREEFAGRMDIYFGAEFDVLRPGAIGAPEDLVALADYCVVAPNHYNLTDWVVSPHGSISQVAEHELSCIETAVQWPHTSVVAHPFAGALPSLDHRPNLVYAAADKNRLHGILCEAAAQGKVFEINRRSLGNKFATDLPEFYERCLDLGMRLAVAGDAHSLQQIEQWSEIFPSMAAAMGLTEADVWRP